MGHRGDIETVYTLQKGLSHAEVERMREGYRKAAEAHLSTSIGLRDVQALDTLKKELRKKDEEIERLKQSQESGKVDVQTQLEALRKQVEEIVRERKRELAARAN